MTAKAILTSLFFILLSCITFTQQVSKYIVIDQFGYLPDMQKIAVIRNPMTGFDASETFIAGPSYALINSVTGARVFNASPVAWNGGMEDFSSGDQIWWFDFSEVKTPGEYYVLDVDKNVRSHKFWISAGVYNVVLKQAVRSFYYQRVGFEKKLPYADEGWTDAASHIGPLQDKNCRLYNRRNDPGTEKDLSGGWYDAGDYNKYTNWTASYAMELSKAYLENPAVWTDDFNIPESGNGLPDLLDEIKWGVDHLLRMQLESGAVLSIVGLASASPPTKATGQSLYGPETTSASLNTAAAFAISSKAFRAAGLMAYSDTLKARAIKAWKWAVANPDVLFRNNDSSYGSQGLGAGQQEESTYQRLFSKLKAACYLFEITGEVEYQIFFDANYNKANLFAWNFAYPFEMDKQDILLHYASLPNATKSVSTHIQSIYRNAINTGSENLPAFTGLKDPYRAHLKDYTWGSNGVKSAQGNMFYGMITHKLDESKNEIYRKAAATYINYIHGVNPLGLVYLSNMYRFGGDNCVNEFYHTWFSNGSALWDRVGVSTYGPAPGFLTGGPNPSYAVDGCCPGSCGSAQNNALCTSENLIPPRNQPRQKSYKDFNTSWPLNSWSVTENSNGYQVNYIRLLSKFVNPDYDCSGVLGGSAKIDACGRCAGGNTGITPANDPKICSQISNTEEAPHQPGFQAWFDATKALLHIQPLHSAEYQLQIVDLRGIKFLNKKLAGEQSLSTHKLNPAFYIALLTGEHSIQSLKFVVQ